MKVDGLKNSLEQTAAGRISRTANHRGPRRRSHAKAGFTFTDLMVSVAAGSLVLGIGSLQLSSTKARSRLVVCQSNLGKVDAAIIGYANDNNQSLPAMSSDLPGNVWWWYKEQVKRYAGLAGPSSTNDLLFACPDDRGYSDPIPFHLNGRFDFNSYVFNGVTLPGMPNIAGLRVSDIKRPARTLLAMEWTAHGPLSWHKSRTGRSNSPFYCDAQNVVGFVDGHVSFSKIYYDGYNAAYTRDPIDGYDYQYSAN